MVVCFVKISYSLSIMSEKLWTPTDKDYQRYATRKPNRTVHKVGIAAVSRYTEREFGDPIILQTEGFKALDKTKGNILLVPSHRNKLETVEDPDVFERVGLHHARPSAKVELFQKMYMRILLGQLGAFPVARGSADQEAYFAAIRAMLASGDIVTLYGEGERITKDVDRIAPIKHGVVRAILESSSTVVVVGKAGMSEERVGKGEDSYTTKRDHRSKHGDGPRLVYSFGDPFDIKPISIEPGIHRKELTRAEFSQRREEMDDRALTIQVALQAEFDKAYQERGSMLEDVYAPPLAA
jgi:1-acyl-sn-glycerol-3-phosphate acyltransferase